MSLNSQTLADTRVYAQDTQPTDERDGIIWVDTSVSPRDTFVFSSSSNSWENISPSNVYQQNTAPTNPANGDLWVDTDSARRLTFVWDNSVPDWIQVTAPTITQENPKPATAGYITPQPYGTPANWWDNDTATYFTIDINDNSTVTFTLDIDQTQFDEFSDGVRFMLGGSDTNLVVDYIRAYYTDGSFHEFQTGDVSLGTWESRSFETGELDYWEFQVSHPNTSTQGYRTFSVAEIQPHKVHDPVPHTHSL